MSSTNIARRTHLDLAKLKQTAEKIAAIACYDATFASLAEEAGIEVIIIGDSLGMVVQGHNSTVPVELEHMIYHTKAVLRGSKRPFIIADLPFGSYQANKEQAFNAAVKLLKAGAQAIKIEGGKEILETVRFLSQHGVAVCAHVGLNPQAINTLGGFKVQGRGAHEQIVLNDAEELEKAGAVIMVIEAVPNQLAAKIEAKLKIPTIGIGAGPHCSGQVLVSYDLLGIGLKKPPRFVKNFLAGKDSIAQALATYVQEIKANLYPSQLHTYD